MTWRPLLCGMAANAAREAASAIVADLQEPSDWPARHAHGIALVHAYAGDSKRAAAFMDRAVRYLEDNPLPPALFGGVCGIAWVMNHLDPDCDDAADSVDDLVVRAVSNSPASVPYDLITGLVGLGVYALGRMPRDSARTMLRSIVARLDALTVRDADGICWLNSSRYRTAGETSCYDIGMAHGIAGVVAFLAQVRRSGVEQGSSVRMLDGAVRWLAAHRLPSESPSAFASEVPLHGTMTPARLAWCYGDPGVALALHAAWTSTSAGTVRELALEVAVKAAARDPASSGVVDSGLCHGAAGLGHIFNRLHQAIGGSRLQEAAIHWFSSCLSLRQSGRGIGGFQSLQASSDGSGQWGDDASLTTGAPGIALALLAATEAIEPRWDALFLMDVASV